MYIEDYKNTPYDAYTDDEYPIIDLPELEKGAPRTEETNRQAAARRRHQYDIEQGILTENELLEESPIYDSELSLENLENED